METILVNLIGDIFTIAGLFYDDLQPVPPTIAQLKEVLEKAGVTVSENSIEKLTLHLENLDSVSGHKLGHARILTEREEKILQEYDDDARQAIHEEIPTEEEAMREADEFERELMKRGEIGVDY